MKKIIFTVLAAASLLAFATPWALAVSDDHNPIGVSGAFEGVITTGCAYNVLNHNATRAIDDIVVPGSIGKYPLKMTRYYNSRRTGSWGLMGPGWSHEYLWISNNGKFDFPNGNQLDGSCETPLAISDGWQTTGCNPSCTADFRLADGGTIHFDDSNGYFEARTIKDPYGQITTLTYLASGLLLNRVTEPGGRYLQFTYSGSQISRVDAYDGRGNQIDWVVYHYTAITPGGGHPSVNCLTSVDYSDGTHTYYTYEQDNVPDDPNNGSVKAFPLINGCDDVRYHGPMRRIAFDYQDQGPHGAILKERYWDGTAGHEGSGVAVSSIGPSLVDPRTTLANFPTTFTETRGDSPTRTFTYTDLHLHRFSEDTCPTLTFGPAPQQFIQSYTDFQGHTAQIGYDANWYISSVTDANNHMTSYTHGPPPNAYPGPKGIGQITQIKHPDNTHSDYTYYDESPNISGHYLKQITDERGNVTFYGRDTNNRVTYIWYEDNLGNVLAGDGYGYNSFGQVTSHLLRNGAFESFVYDGRGLLTDKYNPKSGSIPGGSDPHTHYDYYTSGPWTDRVQRATLPPNFPNNLQASETYEYDRALDANGITNLNGAAVAGRGLVTKVTHADGTYQQFKYDAYGNKRWEDNELRQATSYTYDDYNRMLTVTNPLNKTTTYTYKPTSGNGTSPYLHTTSNPDTVTTPTGIVTTNDYDQNFRKSSTTVGSSTTGFTYDNVGNLIWVTDPLIHKTYNTYDTRNRKITTTEAYGTSVAQTTTWHYDAANNIYQIDRPDNTQETKVFDALNRVHTDTVPKDNNTTTTTTFNYNPSGTISSVLDGNNHPTSFIYDASDRKVTMTYANNTQTQSWAYDDAGNMESRTTVNGEIQYFTYDGRNRKTANWWSNWNDTSRNPDWCYFGYDDANRLTEAENGTNGWGANIISDVHRSYDAAGHLTLDQQIVTGLGTANVNYASYDDDGRLTRMYVSGAPGYDFTYSYDTMGRFEKILLTPSTPLFQYHYDAASNETERDNLFNGVNQFSPRDALNRMTSWDAKKGNTTLAHEGYTYDAMNRITGVSYSTGPADSFGYYQDGELNTATLGNLAHNLTYNLDKAGNRTSVVDNNVSSTYVPNTINQYYPTAAGNSITNGLEHQISGYQGVSYTYINDERLSSASSGTTTYSMVYDALGRCVKRSFTSGPTTYYFYDGEKPILEYDVGGSVGTNVYGKGIDEILERIAIGSDSNWYTYYPQQNHEGSVTLLTDTTGNAIERYRYDAFGAPTIYTPSWATRSNTIYDNRFLFTGREFAATYRSTHNTSAFNFYEYRARAYNPILGRFMSEDPKLFDAGDYNLFRYCHNDPIDNVDPMGLQDTVATHSPYETSRLKAELREAVQQALRQAAQQRAYATAYSRGNFEGGTSFIGKANFQTTTAAKPRNDMKVLARVTPHDPTDKQLRPGERATTEASLTDPVAVEGPEGMIVRALLPIDVYFAKNASWAERGKEMANVFSLKTWAEDDVPRLVAPLRNVNFANPRAAAEAMEAAIRRDFNRTYFNLKMKDLGENIIVE